MVKAEMEIEAKSYPMNGELADLFRAMSKSDTLRLLFLADRGIVNSTHAIEELNITQKIYYSRLNGLIESGLVRKMDGAYRQTVLGNIMHDHFLPAMGKTVNSKGELEFLAGLEGMEMENGLRKSILDKLDILGFAGSSNVRMLRDYEALAIEAVDMSDSAEERILLASNYFDVRVIEATIRAVDRGVTNRIIVGKKSINSKLKQLKMMLSLSFTKSIINFFSNSVDLKDFCRFVNIPYTFCIVDGHLNLIEISNITDGSFMLGFSVDDKDFGKKLTDFFETFWDLGESDTGLKFVDSINS